jgi:hypothetical protein
LSSVAVRCALLAAAVSVAYPLVAYVAAIRFGPSAWSSAAVAAVVCGVGAVLALALTSLLRGPQGALYGVLFGFAFRMGLPMAAAVVTQFANRSADGALLSCLVAFYFVTLIVETVLVLPLVQAGAQAKAA